MKAEKVVPPVAPILTDMKDAFHFLITADTAGSHMTILQSVDEGNLKYFLTATSTVSFLYGTDVTLAASAESI